MVHLVTKVAEYGIIVDKKQFLMVQWGEHYNYTWHFPGGRINANEKEKEGLIREIKEEIGVEISDIKPVYAKYIGPEFNQEPGDQPRYALFYLCKLKKGQKIKLNEQELRSFKWFKKSEIKKIKFWLPFYREMLDEVLPF